MLLVLPLFHVYGLNAGLGMVAATGAPAVLVERFDARATLDLVPGEGVTNIPGAPPMYVAWARCGRSQPGVAARRAAARVGRRPLPPAVQRAGARPRPASPCTRATG